MNALSGRPGGSQRSRVKSCVKRASRCVFAVRACIFHVFIFLDVLLGVFWHCSRENSFNM